jgi:hypothetical protein
MSDPIEIGAALAILARAWLKTQHAPTGVLAQQGHAVGLREGA